MNARGVGAYRQTDVVTADPKRLVIMCYGGAIDNLKAAKKRFLAGEFEAKARSVQKAQDIIDELTHTLDFEQGGEIAKNLDSLYNYMSRRIIYAEANKDMGAIDEVTGMLKELKEAWEEIFYGSEKVAVAAAPTADAPDDSVRESVSLGYGPGARL